MASNANLPYIVIKDFWLPTIEEKKKMVEHVHEERRLYRESNHCDKDDWTTSTTMVNDEDDLFGSLHDMFMEQVEECFGPYETKKKHRRECYGYTISNRYWGFNPHQHKCEVNAVYYLNIPESDNPLWGSLWLTEDWEADKPMPWDYIIPEEGMLVLMPGWLWHDPFYVPTKEHRIAINMEARLKRYPDAEEYHEWNKRYI